jgi:hypothetical protein
VSLPVIAAFWHGSLSWLEQLCLGSFVAQGHAVELYSYDTIGDLPKGVAARDAAEVVPRERLVFYKGRGTPGVFSDLFRMSVLQQRRGIWADADVYCIRPIADPPAYLMGYERPPDASGKGGSINGAVLLLPHDSALLDDLIGVFGTGPRPLFEPHLPLGRRLEVAAKRVVGIKVAPEYMQYGATGPFALTHFVAKHELLGAVQPAEVFYPVRYEAIPALMQPGSSIEAALTPRTLAVHLWRSQLTRRGRAAMPWPAAGSALAALCARDGIQSYG